MKTTTLIGLLALSSTLLTGCKEGCFLSGGCEETTQAAAPVPGAEGESATTTAVATKTVMMRVVGMSCGGCANAVKNKVDGVSGVVSCDVSFEKGMATVGLSDPKAEKNVEDVIRKLGYTVSVQSESPAQNTAS